MKRTRGNNSKTDFWRNLGRDAIRFLSAVAFLGIGMQAGAPAHAQSQALTLDQAVEMALRGNPDLQKQKLARNAAAENGTDLRSQRFGKISVVSSYNHYNLPRTLAPLTPSTLGSDPLNIATTQNLFSAGIAYELELFTGFAKKRAVEISDLKEQMADIALKLGKERLIYNVKALYVKILSLQAQARAQATYIAALQTLYDNISLEVQLGKKARVDQLKAAADLESARASLSELKANVSLMKGSLASLLGVAQIPQLVDLDIPPGYMVRIEEDYSDQIADSQRLLSAQLAVTESRKLVKKSLGSRYPQLVLSSIYGSSFGPNDSGHIDSGSWHDETVWQVGLNLKWNIFDFGSRQAKIQQAKIRERQSVYDQAKTTLELQQSLREGVTQINAVLDDYVSAEAECSLTSETASIEQVRFDRGASDINDLLHARARNLLAESRLINAKYEYCTARFYLNYLLENGENP